MAASRKDDGGSCVLDQPLLLRKRQAREVPAVVLPERKLWGHAVTRDGLRGSIYATGTTVDF